MTDETTAAECDGYPPIPLGGDFEELQRYASTRVYAEMLRGYEDIEERLVGVPAPRATPAERWAAAQTLFDRGQAEKAERDRQAADLARRVAEDPDLARMQFAFDAAKEACRVGHDAGCTYGGMSASHGHWLALEDCAEPHADVCALRFACDGAEASTGFVGHEWDEDWIWLVASCQPCADAYTAKRPEFARRGSEGNAS